MDTTAILNQLKELEISISVSGDKLHLEPGSRVPANLLNELRQHKTELLAFLENKSPEWHANEVARLVEKEGVCIFWSEVFGELIAFVKDDSCRASVPAGTVTFSSDELYWLFGDEARTPSPHTMRLIYEAKKVADARTLNTEGKQPDG